MRKITLLIILTTTMVFAFMQKGYAQITSAAAGNWSNPATWTGNAVPTSTDNVIIANAVIVDDASAVCKDLSFTTGSISFGAATSVLSVYGNSTFGSGITNITSWTSGAKLVFTGTAAQTWTTTATSRFDAVEVNKTSGTVTQAGSNFSIGTSLNVLGGGTLTIGSTFKITGATFAAGTTTPFTISVGVGSTFNHDFATAGAISQSTSTLAIGSVTVYGTMNLGTSSGTGFKFGAVTVGDGTNAASLNITTNMTSSGMYSFASLAVNANSTFNMNATTMAASTITGDITGTGTVVYGAAASTNHPTLDRSFGGNLTIGAATRTWATTAPRTVSGNLIINGSGTHTGTFTSPNTLTVNGDLTITGTSRLTWSGGVSCGGNVTVNSTNTAVALYPSSATATLSGVTGKTFSVGATTILRTSATGTTPITTQYGGFSTFTCDPTSTIEYYKTATAAISVQDEYNGTTISYGKLIVSHNNTSGSSTMSVTINNPTIVTSLTLAEANGITATTQTMNITFANTSSLTIPSLTATTANVAGSYAQSIMLGAQPVIVTGNVSLTDASSTVTATSCVLTINSSSLTINGNLTVGGTVIVAPFNTPYILLNDPASSLIVGGTTSLRSCEQTNGNIKFTNNSQIVTFNGACNTTLGNANSETFNFNGFNPTINFNGNFSDAATGTTFSVTGTEVPVINFNNGTLGTPMTTTAAGLRGAVTVNGYRQVTGTNFRTTNATTAAYSMNIAGTLDLLANGSTATNTGGGTNSLSGTGTIKLTGDYATKVSGYSTNDFQGTGTIHFAGSVAQTIPAGTYSGIKVENAAGVTLGGNTTVTGTLALTTGTLATSTNSLTIGATGTVSGASATSYVNGNLIKLIAANTTTKSFEIGDATTYAPVTLDFDGTISNSTGSIQASTTAADHVQIAGSNLNASKSANRTWTLTNATALTGLNSYSPTFNFVSGDVDVDANTSNFIIGNYSNSAWGYPTVGTKTTTSTQATGVTTFGDFAVGEDKGGATAINSVKQSNQIKHTAYGIEVSLNGNSSIELYTMNGLLIDKTTASGSYSHNLNNGIYIIRINGKAIKFVK